MVRQAIVLLLLLAGSSTTAPVRASQAGVGPARATTIGEALAAAGVDTTGLSTADLARPVADVTIEREEATVLLACYEHGASGPPATLLVMVRDGALQTWRRATVDAAAAGAGAVTQVRRAGPFTLIDTQKDDWTDVMLVLDASLRLLRTFPGHLLAPLPDGTVMIQENASQYSPTTPVFVALFAPAEDGMIRIHPLEPASPPRKRFVERVKRKYGSMSRSACEAAGHRCDPLVFDGAIVSDVRVDPRGARVAWVERLGPADTAHGALDFSIHVVVACDRPTVGPAANCRERAFGGYDGPDGKLTQEVLDSVIASPAK